jgi:hypothetical protein
VLLVENHAAYRSDGCISPWDLVAEVPVEKHKIRSGLPDWLGQSWINIEVCAHAMAANYTGAQIMPEFFSASTFVLGNAD